jgi:NADPH:quinone reductase-like Zn-dependent oxidoreductase
MKIFFVGAGTDVAGEVADVGSGVKNFKAGDKVVAMLNFAVKYSIFLSFLWFCEFFLGTILP